MSILGVRGRDYGAEAAANAFGADLMRQANVANQKMAWGRELNEEAARQQQMQLARERMAQEAEMQSRQNQLQLALEDQRGQNMMGVERMRQQEASDPRNMVNMMKTKFLAEAMQNPNANWDVIQGNMAQAVNALQQVLPGQGGSHFIEPGKTPPVIPDLAGQVAAGKRAGAMERVLAPRMMGEGNDARPGLGMQDFVKRMIHEQRNLPEGDRAPMMQDALRQAQSRYQGFDQQALLKALNTGLLDAGVENYRGYGYNPPNFGNPMNFRRGLNTIKGWFGAERPDPRPELDVLINAIEGYPTQ